MAPHPCCGGSLQRGTKIVAIIEIVLSVLTIIITVLGILALLALNEGVKNDSKNTQEDKETAQTLGTIAIVVLGFVLLLKVFQLIIAIFLLQGANARNLRKCRIWFIVTCILVGFSVLNFLFEVSSGGGVGSQTFSAILNIILNVYFLWVVWAFMDELKGEQTEITSGGVTYNKP